MTLNEFFTGVMQFSQQECGLIVDRQLRLLVRYNMDDTELASLRQSDPNPLLRKILLDGWSHGQPIQVFNVDYLSADDRVSCGLRRILMIPFVDNTLLWYGEGRCSQGVFAIPDADAVAAFMCQIEPELNKRQIL